MDINLDQGLTEPTGELNSIDIKRYFYLLRSYWWVLLLTTLLGGAAAFISSSLMTPIYSAATTLLIDTNRGSSRTTASDLSAGEQLATTYAIIVESPRIRQQVADQVGLEIDQLGKIDADHVGGTQLLRITIENENPLLAAHIANTVAEVFANETQSLQTNGFSASKENLQAQLDYLENQIANSNNSLEKLDAQTPEAISERNRLEDLVNRQNQSYTTLLQSFEELRLAELQATSNIMQIDPAEVPLKPVRPRIMITTVLGTIVGLLLGVGIVLFSDFLDDTIKSSADIERLTRVPVMASVGRLRKATNEPGSELITINQPRDPSSESFRDLRTALLFSAVDKPNGTIVVTSANPSEGKSTVAANLAVVLAQAGNNVLLVDCDLRRPRQSTIFGRPNHTGLSMLLLEYNPQAEASEADAVISNAIQPVSLGAQGSNLWLMASGPIPPNPSELLGSAKMKVVLAQLSTRYDYVIIDTPPALIVTDPYVISMRADGVILVVSAGSTRHNDVVNSVNRFRELRAPILGAVLNNKSTRTGNYYYNDKKPYYQQNKEVVKDSRRQALLKRLGFGRQ
ncbi:MAG: polysaccharide biosynthesis tyrosine autokinase [Anaerolineales bacterium]|nr:polysaccharide biosynthesis tyrosine autokinase [Anaerolineales bacterium]